MEEYEDIFVQMEADEIRIASIACEGFIEGTAKTVEKVGQEVSLVFQGRPVETNSLAEAGARLFKALFGGTAADVYYQTVRLASRRNKGVRICLDLSRGAQGVADLPWEVLYDPEKGDFLALARRHDIVRRLRSVEPPAPPAAPKTKVANVLFAASSPNDLPPLPVEFGWRYIKEVLQHRAGQAASSDSLLLSATAATLRERLLKGQYSIVHLLGHGSRQRGDGGGSIALEGAEKRADWVEAEQLTQLFLTQRARLVILAAPESLPIAPALVGAGIPSVLCFNFAIGYEDLNNFFHSFYSAMIDGMSISDAMRAGRKSIMFSSQMGAASWGSAVLYSSNPDEVLFSSYDPQIYRSKTGGGAVIYSGGGMAGSNSFFIQGEGNTVNGDVIGQDKIASKTLTGKSGDIVAGARGNRLDRVAIKEHLQQLELLIVDSDLNSAQRVKGLVYLERLEKAILTDSPSWGEVEKLLTKISQLNSDMASVIQKVWTLLPLDE